MHATYKDVGNIKSDFFVAINSAALIRYSIAGNFLGLPAVTVPVYSSLTVIFVTLHLNCNHFLENSALSSFITQVGYDKLGLPIGLQFIGRPWAEATLIHLAFAMQVNE